MDRPLPRYDFEQSVGAWIVPAARALVHAMNEELARHGVTHQQWTVLLHLAQEPDVSQAALAERIGIEAPTLCRILDRMERHGWIAREPCPDDRRRNRIRLADRVEPVWRQIVESARRVRARATRGLDEDQLRRLRETLTVVRQNLENGSPA
jgi:MarR family transcriptional regulator for hemolysin